jgi:diacylglycerol O-acyltransferase
MLSKAHHALVDGVSGTDMLAVLMDASPDGGGTEASASAEAWEPEPMPSGWSLATDALASMVRSPYEQVRAARAQTRMLRRLVSYAREVMSGLVTMGGLVRPTPLSSLNGPLGPHRRYAWAATTVTDIRRVRKELGGTFNDVVLASITNGFRELLLSRGEDVERVVRTLVPVSVRPRDESGRAVGDGTFENRVAAMFAELPVDIEDPALRLAVISEQMTGLKESKQAMAGEALTSMSGFAPPMLLAVGMRLATKAGQRNVNTVTTNVPGPQFPLYAAGRRMIRAFPYVPLAGQVRIGIAIFSYDGEVTFGITGDYDTTADIDVLAHGIEDGMTQLLKLCDGSA